MYELIDIEERKTEVIDNQDFKFVFNDLIANAVRNINFKKLHDIHKVMDIKWSSLNAVPSPKQIQATAFELSRECLSNMLSHEYESYYLEKEGLQTYIYGLNYPDPEKAGTFKLMFCFDSNEQYFKDFMHIKTIEQAEEEKEYSTEEKLFMVEEKVRRVIKILEKSVS